MEPATRNLKLAAYGLGAVVLVPLFPIGRWIAPGDSLAALLTHEAIFWLYAVAVLSWLVYAENEPLSSIGLRRPTLKSFLFALAAATTILLIMVFHFAVIVRALHLDTTAAQAMQHRILAQPYWFRFCLVLRAAVMEEMVWRGYVIEKTRQLTGNTLLAVILSVVAFTGAHFSGWGMVQLIPVCGAGVVLGLLYVARRDLGSNMIAHFLTDGAGFLLR
jgi:membrane protease YdiL (CAAX protease family)